MKQKMDMILKNVQVYNSYFKTLTVGNVWILDGKFYYIDEGGKETIPADQIIDGDGRIMIPGLIDIHMHIESSMMTPKAFCQLMAGCGVTTIVSEPHEMANVAGVKGVQAMIEEGEASQIDVFYGIPSCVPATNPSLETTGGIIGFEEMVQLRQHPNVICVGEVMNYRQIIQEENLDIQRFLTKLRSEDKNYPIEGHCPSLTGRELAEFLYLGINGDHTEHNLEELRQRFAGGMFVEIQGKMLNKEVLDYIRVHNLYEHFAFVTDDVMADVLCREGHLNTIIQEAINLGIPPLQAIYNATFTSARRMNLLDRGSIAPGKLADFVLLNSLDPFTIYETYKNGHKIYSASGQNKTSQPEIHIPSIIPESPSTGHKNPATQMWNHPEFYHTINLPQQAASIFEISVPGNDRPVTVRAIEVISGTTRTREKHIPMKVQNGKLVWQNTGCLLTAVFQRYTLSPAIGFAFLTGDCHKTGTAATSYAHDNHNILVSGDNPHDMTLALNWIITHQGGICTAQKNQILSGLPLPIGGILSDRPAIEVGEQLETVTQSLIKLGYNHPNPVMSFATLTLTASPSLKITDKGLIDVEKGSVIPLIIE